MPGPMPNFVILAAIDLVSKPSPLFLLSQHIVLWVIFIIFFRYVIFNSPVSELSFVLF